MNFEYKTCLPFPFFSCTLNGQPFMSALRVLLVEKKNVLQGFKSSGAKQAAAHFMLVKSDRYWKKSLNLSTGYNHQNIPM